MRFACRSAAVVLAAALSSSACGLDLSAPEPQPIPPAESAPLSVPAAPAEPLAGPPAEPMFRAPVSAPVSDPFRLPEGSYGPGNRGIEYDTEPGDAVAAAAAGEVIFAGSVAGSLHVTVDHGGGVVSSYSYLERIAVPVGARVARGDSVGTASERLHFGVRVDGAYVDPASLNAVGVVTVRLVPLDAP